MVSYTVAHAADPVEDKVVTEKPKRPYNKKPAKPNKEEVQEPDAPVADVEPEHIEDALTLTAGREED